MTKRYAFSYLVGNENAERPKRPIRLNELPKHLQGPGQNRFGGHQTQRLRPFKGSSFGAASVGRSLSPDERKIVEQELREKGIIDTIPNRKSSESD